VCSNKESHWHDVVFTYKLSDDGATVSWVGIFVDGKEKVVSDPLTYKRLDDGTFFRKSESNNVIWDYTLRFHLDKLEISTFHSKEGMFGTCELTLNSIE
jgi:hypothetical protein